MLSSLIWMVEEVQLGTTLCPGTPSHP